MGLRVTAVVLAGVAVGIVADIDAIGALALVLIAAGLRVLWRHSATTLAVAVAMAIAHGVRAREQALEPPPAEWLAVSDPVSIVGTLLDDASVVPAGVRLDLRSGRTRLRVTVTGSLAGARVAEWTRGRSIVAPVRVRLPDPVRNPGSPSETWQSLVRPFDVLGTVKSGALVEVTPGAWWDDAAARVRGRVRRAVSRHVGVRDPEAAAVVTAILIGDRSSLDEATTRRLQYAGTFHVIAISGGNIAMLAATLLLAMRAVTRSTRAGLLVTLTAVVAYGFIVGGEPSVVRAVAAASLYLMLRLGGVTPAPINLLAVVAAISVLWDPLVAIDVGAWLSFGATWGLIVLLPRMIRPELMLLPPDRARVLPAMPSWRPARVLVIGCLATLAAEIVIMPVTATIFGRISLAGLALNLVAIPAMALVQLGGFALCGFDVVSESMAAVPAWVAATGVSALLGSASLVEFVPWLSWRVPPSSALWLCAYYACLAIALHAAPRWRRAAVSGMGVATLVIMTAPFVEFARPGKGWLRVSMLDVGQGDAILVQTPSRHALLVDAGGAPGGTFDVGGRVVTPAVWALGERRVDWLALTHGDLDHVGGAVRIVQDLRPREVWEGIPVEAAAPLAAVRATARDAGAAWRRLLAGHELHIGDVSVTVLHPRAPEWHRVRVRNDDSLVLAVSYGDVEIVLTGDAGAEFEGGSNSRWPSDEGGPRFRILKVAHHGSRSSSAEDFLARLSPQVALISTGARNLFGHPSPVVLSRLEARQVTTYRTDRHGAVLVETDGREVRVRPMVGATLTAR